MISFPTEPMKANLGTLPNGADDANWAYEVKWDGYRTLAFIVDGRLRLQSTKGIDVTGKYPELAGLPGALAVPDAVLDGELVVLDDDGKPRFELIQRHERQATFFVFDLLHLAGHDTTGLPYENRRALLVQSLEAGSNWSVPEHRIGDGAALLAATAAGGLEGIMAKRLGSAYLVGKRSPSWRKVKNRVRTTVTIGGFTAGTGNRAGTFGALLVGTPLADGRLQFGGGVGTGFNTATLESLTATMRALSVATSPFAGVVPREYVRTATWIRPELRAEIEIAEWTNEGLVRHASYLGLA